MRGGFIEILFCT